MGLPLGRPPTYDDAMREAICAQIVERIAKGEPLAQICRDDWLPSQVTVWTWQQNYPSFAEAIARARDHGADQVALDALLIADGQKPLLDDDGKRLPPDAGRDKLRAEIRLKLLAKWNPKKYGEGIQLRHANADGSGDQPSANAPLVAELRVLLATPRKTLGDDSDKS